MAARPAASGILRTRQCPVSASHQGASGSDHDNCSEESVSVNLGGEEQGLAAVFGVVFCCRESLLFGHTQIIAVLSLFTSSLRIATESRPSLRSNKKRRPKIKARLSLGPPQATHQLRMQQLSWSDPSRHSIRQEVETVLSEVMIKAEGIADAKGFHRRKGYAID
jgi:hypothetical protein